ncbi:MAG: hypothetical protein ACNA7J_13840, partial [Wenzhouxiangella sp.]
LKSAQLNADGGEQLLIVGSSSQGTVAFDALSGSTLWQIENSGQFGLHAHDIDGNGRDEILLIRRKEFSDYVIEWRDASGAILEAGSLANSFRHAVVFDLLGTGEPQILLREVGARGNALLSLDLQTLHDLPRPETTNFSRFSLGQVGPGQPTLDLVPGMNPFPAHGYLPRLRSIDGGTGALRWTTDLDPSLNREVRDITGLDAGDPAWQFGSIYVLSQPLNHAAPAIVTEVDANSGIVLRSREQDLGGSPYRILAIDQGGDPRLLLVSHGPEGTHYHLMNPQYLQVEWSSPALPLGFSGGNYLLDLADDSHLLITTPMAQFTGTRLVDLATGDILFNPGQGIVASALVHDSNGVLLVAAHHGNQVLRLHDPGSSEIVLESALGLDLTALTQVGPTLLLLAETDRIHLFDLDAEQIVCSSDFIGVGNGRARGFVPDPARSDRWLIGNYSGIYSVTVTSEARLYHDRFETSEADSSLCQWQ